MRDSLREAYNSFYSQRQSKSVSPTTGRVHKQRESFGPTVCLINKNPQSQTEINNDKAYLLMLILEIQRLNKIVASLQTADNGELSENQRSQLQFLRKQVLNLKAALQRSERQKYEQIQRQNKAIYSSTNKINQYETHMSISNRKIKQFEQTNQGLINKINNLEEQLGRAKTEAAKANMNLFMSSQTELQKSAIRDKSSAMEMEIWKQKLGKYENMINEQKQFISEQKRVIDKLQNTQLEIRQRYEYDISMLKKNNQQLQQRYNKLQRELSNKVLNTSAEASRQLSSKLREMDNLKQKIEEQTKENQQLRKNLQTVAKNKSQNIEEMRLVIGELRQSLEQLNNDYHQQSQKFEKAKLESDHLKKQNQSLKSQLQRINKNHSSEVSNLQDALSNRQLQIKRIKKQKKRNELEGRNHKSYSQSNFRTATSLKSSTADLGGIIRDVMELQDSNTRVNRLIETTQSRVVHNKVYSYSSYGL